MKIKEGFVIREVMGQTVVIPTGKASQEFSGMIKLNDTGRDIWKSIEEGMTEEEIIEKICKIYEVSKEDAQLGVKDFIFHMKEEGYIENQ